MINLLPPCIFLYSGGSSNVAFDPVLWRLTSGTDELDRLWYSVFPYLDGTGFRDPMVKPNGQNGHRTGANR